MEAWILHIKTETNHADGVYVGNTYNAWMSEKQAYKAAAKYLRYATDSNWVGPFVKHEVLFETVKTLVELDKIQESIKIVNHYSEASPYQSGKAQSSKVYITIIKSTFLGSPFE